MVKLGVAQIDPQVGCPEENLTTIRSILEEAERCNVDILVVPELSNSGYVFESKDEVRSSAEIIPKGKFSEILFDWSSSDCFVVAGICEKSNDSLYNSAVVFSCGKYLGTYRKVHLFDQESNWFSAGETEPPVFKYREYQLGIMICFDWAFPEMARVLALKNAQVLLHPANLVLPYCHNAMVTRSIENRVFTATANRVGEERGIRFSGASQVTNPKGELLVKMTNDEVGLTWVDIDPSEANNKMITKHNHILQDRRPSVYRKLCEST
jgi:predicted amidohydrolase